MKRYTSLLSQKFVESVRDAGARGGAAPRAAAASQTAWERTGNRTVRSAIIGRGGLGGRRRPRACPTEQQSLNQTVVALTPEIVASCEDSRV